MVANLRGRWAIVDPSKPIASAAEYYWFSPPGQIPITLAFSVSRVGSSRLIKFSLPQEDPTKGDFAEASMLSICHAGIDPLLQFEMAATKAEGKLTDEELVHDVIIRKDELSFLHAIFAHRQDGRMPVRRNFKGKHSYAGRRDDWGEALAPNVLRQIKAAPTPAARQRLVQEAVCREFSLGRPTTVSLAVETWSGKSLIDRVLLDGIGRDLLERDGIPARVRNPIARALISGWDEEEIDQEIRTNPAQWQAFKTRLYLKFQEAHQRGDSSAFDRWFVQERKQSFHRLLPGYRRANLNLNLTDKQILRQRGMHFFRRILWEAYEQMARTYGTVMMLAWNDATDDPQIRMTADEQQVFRALNFPQFAFAGLPLAFFPPAPMAWLKGPIEELLRASTSDQFAEAIGYRRKSVLHDLTNRWFDLPARMLGKYGELTAERKRHERERKAVTRSKAKINPAARAMVATGIFVRTRDNQEKSTDSYFDVVEDSADTLLDDPETFPALKRNACPACGSRLRVGKLTVSSNDKFFIGPFYCEFVSCGFQGEYRVANDEIAIWSLRESN